MSVEELKKAEKLCRQKIDNISQQLVEVEAKMKEVDTKRSSLQATFKKAYEEFQASTEMFRGFQSSAAKLRKEITSKSQEVRRLLNAKKEADLRALRSEINLKELELMSLKSLQDVKLKNFNNDKSDPGSIEPRLKNDERMTATSNEIASKKQMYEDLNIQHRALQDEETRLKEELRAVFFQLNQSKINSGAAEKKTKNAQKEMDALTETLSQFQSQQKRKSIELLDAKDSLLDLEIRRKRKKLQIEREKWAEPDPSASSSTDPHSSDCQVSF